ncbi:MAG TPA: hypothetical protein VGJ95_24010 [Pseudonocardiaceae bacterium]|jgi:hypothetical protein
MGKVYAVVLEQLDTRLDELRREREQLMREPAGLQRSTRMMELYEAEAAVWSEIIDHCRTRVYWRAALGAREYALAAAGMWRRRAAADQLWTGGTVTEEVAA